MQMSKRDLLALSAKTGQHFSPDVLKSATAESKHKNQITVVDNIKFASKWEAEYYGQLKLRVRAGEISGLTVHHAFDLAVQGVHITRYVADFVFIERGIRVVHDTKGSSKGGAYDLFRVKARLMKAVLGIDVVEVRRPDRG